MNKVLKFMPCPAYDVERMESYLSDLAKDGLFLTADGFFCGFGFFERKSPQPVRYRLAAAVRRRGLFDDDGGAPSEEELEAYRQCGWEYVAARGQFYIYRSGDPEALEPDTDAAVQAIAIGEVRKREIGNLIANLFWVVLYPLLMLSGGLLHAVLEIKTPLAALLTALIIWMLIENFRRVIHLRKLRKRLQNTEGLQHDKDWRKGALSYRAGQIISTALDILCAVLLIITLSRSISDQGEIPLAEYQGEVPFATLADISQSESYVHENLLESDNVTVDSDPLAPVMIHWHETGRWTDENGDAHSGGLVVDYYETISPALAKELAKEFVQSGRHERHYKEYDIRIDADYARSYTAIFPTVVIQEGNKIIRATFYQTAEPEIPMEEWMNCIAQSIQ